MFLVGAYPHFSLLQSHHNSACLLQSQRAHDVGITSKFSLEQCNNLISTTFQCCSNAKAQSRLDHNKGNKQDENTLII